jgi:hypothetical protein
MDEIFRERGHIKLEMFVNEDKATKPIVKKKLTKMMEEIKIEPTRYEIPQLPVKSKFNYKNDFIERERNPNNKGVKPFYNKITMFMRSRCQSWWWERQLQINL